MKTSRTKKLVAIFAAIAAVLTLAVGPLGSVTAQAAAPTGTQVVFRDDFSGSSLSSAWLANSAEIGSAHGYPGGPWNFGTGEIEEVTNKPANVGVKDGNLYITPQRDPAGNWTSARIETYQSNFKPPIGSIMRVDGRLAMPAVTGAEAAGYWPAFWMLASPYRQDRWSWPGVGEADFMENVNGINQSWATLHCGIFDNSGPCNETDGVGNGGVDPKNGVAFPGNFHLYSFEWDRSHGEGHDVFRWYNDNFLVHTVLQDTPPVLKNRAPIAPDVWAATWAKMTQHEGYFIILNVAVGGQFPAKMGGGPTAATKPGVPMLVDYVQVSYTGTTVAPTTSATTPTTSSASPTTASTTAPTSPTTSAPTVTTTNTTAPSSTSPSTTSPTSASGVPTNFKATSTNSTVTLTWDGDANPTYVIRRGENNIPIQTVTGNTYTDIGLQAGIPYVYSVKGPDGTTPQLTIKPGSGITVSASPTTTSTTTTQASTTTSAPPTTTAPSPTTTVPVGDAKPTNLRVTGTTPATISLKWDGTPGVAYEVLRGEAGERIKTVTNGTEFTDGGLLPNTPYVYSIRAVGVTTRQITAFVG